MPPLYAVVCAHRLHEDAPAAWWLDCAVHPVGVDVADNVFDGLAEVVSLCLEAAERSDDSLVWEEGESKQLSHEAVWTILFCI